MDTFFIRVQASRIPANNLQKEVYVQVGTYHEFLTQNPAEVMRRIRKKVAEKNYLNSRCKPLTVFETVAGLNYHISIEKSPDSLVSIIFTKIKGQIN